MHLKQVLSGACNMPQLKRLVFLGVCALVLSRLAWAGVTNISETVFSNRSGAVMSASDGSHTSTTSGVICGTVTADTPEGCNAALGISFGAIATPCDGGKYTCKAPVAANAENPACDSGAKATAAECTQQGATAQACGTEGKYNCICDSNYTKTCDSSQNQFPAPGDACTNSKNETYIPASAQCLSNCKASAGYSTAVPDQADVGACNGRVIQCWSNSEADYMWQCDESCATMQELYPQYRQSSGDCSEYNGTPQGLTCGGGTNLCQCSTADYMADFDATPSCSNPGERPLTDNPCTAENKLQGGSYVPGNKYRRQCGYPLCSATDMTMMNTIYCDSVGWHQLNNSNINTSPTTGDDVLLMSACADNATPFNSSFVGGTKEKYRCAVPGKASCDAISNLSIGYVYACGCGDEYDIVPADTTFSDTELQTLGAEKCGEGEVPVALASPDAGLTNTNICVWDAQTSIKSGDTSGRGTNGSADQLDPSRFRYNTDKCLRVCTDVEAGFAERTGDSCANNQTPGSCALEAGQTTFAAFGVSVPVYYEHKYCGCPLDEEGNNLYHDSCPQGYYLGGKTCNNGSTLLYQYCLKPCVNADGAKSSPWNSADTNCGFAQNMGTLEEYEKGEDANVEDVYYACFTSDKASEVSVQCHCPDDYSTNEECAADGKIGTGTTCDLDRYLNPETKYETCSLECPSSDVATLKPSQEGCKFEDPAFNVNITRAVECFTADDASTLQYQCLCPDSYESKVEHCGGSYTPLGVTCDSNCRDCMNRTVGIGKPCTFESKITGTPNDEVYMYHGALGWGESCSWLQEQSGNNLTIIPSSSSCPYTDNKTCYEDADTQKKVCSCPSDYQTLEEFCNNKEADCMVSYVGVGTPCELDVVGSEKQIKYASFGRKCPDASERPVFDSADSCAIGDISGSSEACYEEGNNGAQKYICTCPESFGRTCEDTAQIRGGAVCSLETNDPNAFKYEKCLPQCQNTSTTPVVANPESCPLVDGFQSNTEEQCFNKMGDAEANYACRCPKGQNYQTLAEYCQNGVTVGGVAYTREECLSLFTGVGTPCTYDEVGVNKYRSFSIICPTDRPVLNSAQDCTTSSIPGEVDYFCYDRDNPNQQRVVCKCPESWVDVQGNSGGVPKCTDNEEPAGQTCNFDGSKIIKYEGCFTRCDKLSSNGQGVTYLDEENNSKQECTNLLGDGATLGIDGDGGACSRNNTLMYPCYCSSSYTEKCLNSDNEAPAPNALACTINGTTWYETCVNNECADESATIARIPDTDAGVSADLLCQRKFGQGASGKRCGEKEVECSCNPREYSETCEYPYKAPDTNDYCVYSSNGGLMNGGKKHYAPGACIVEPELAKCGKYILNADGSKNTSYTIKTATTEAACRSLYGTGAQAQLCEYEENVNLRAYNCYYDVGAYVWTEDNCPVRHVLGEDYIIHNGVKRYKSCDCHSAYKYHKYNCAGMLSGSACTQKIGNVSDATLAGMNPETELSFYPYCQCTADFNQICDGERYVGVGEPCNGKYRACECKPDPLPENWADNYYGCPGGKKPTGVTKPNGCGGKYYQCSVTECTWQHSETCPAPLIGVDPCQDNEGNIGGYKSCKCPDGYVICPVGTVGEGEPCLLKGKYYYQESNCVSESKCSHGESLTCTEPLQIGVNPCTRNGITYFEYCVCASGYNKKCDGDNEVGIGDYCELNGTKFYAACDNPSMTCTSEHKLSCDKNQTSYDPCVNADNQVMYKCKCPTNYLKCEEAGPAEGADSCTDVNGTVYSACAISNGCSEFQLNMYKECSEFQVGSGGSCINPEGKTLFAECKETSECRANGYQYTCQGYDDSIQGDACIDENGNKLYKQCKCPDSYVECTGKNNTKGQSCTPLNANGTTGTTVYESCTCDASIYKYTCEADTDAGNVGIVKGSGKECTYKDANGNEVTKYETCSCNAKYKYTCTGNGQVGDENDYCQTAPGNAPLYQQCTCRSEYNQTCSLEENPGLTKPSDANKACTPQNTEDDTTKYSACECGAQYTLSCNSQGQLKSDTNFCRPDISNPNYLLYSFCDCDAIYQYDCRPTGANQGITKPSGTTESCLKQRYENDILQGVEYFRSCQCKPEYNKTCSGTYEGKTLTYDLYVGLSADYCEIADSSEGSLTTVRTYKKCQCPDNFITCPEGTEAPAAPADGEVCVDVSASGVVTTKYLEGTCQCVPVSPGDDYTAANLQDTNAINRDGATIAANKLSASNQAALKQIFLQYCKHQNNGLVKSDGCGNLYYKCLIDPDTYMYTKENCEKPKTLQGQPETKSGWNGSVTMYNTCDCPSDWYSQETCNARAATVGNKCQISGEKNKSGSYVVCANIYNGSQQALKLYGESCVKNDGTVVQQYCECNLDVFTYKYTGISPNKSCIDDGVDDKVNHRVWVCYFDSVTTKNIVCPSCRTCSWNNVTSSRYQVSRSWEDV